MRWKPVVLALTLVAFGFIVGPLTQVWGACPRTTVSFDRAVTLPAGVVLPPGEYTFQIADMPDLVLVRSKDCEQTFYLGFTNAVARPKTNGGVMQVTFGPAPAGEPTPVMAWYPSGDPNGYAFRY